MAHAHTFITSAFGPQSAPACLTAASSGLVAELAVAIAEDTRRMHLLQVSPETGQEECIGFKGTALCTDSCLYPERPCYWKCLNEQQSPSAYNDVIVDIQERTVTVYLHAVCQVSNLCDETAVQGFH